MLCKYCQKDRPEEDFGIAAKNGDKVYRRLKCKTCKQARQKERRISVRKWLDNYKQDKKCQKCGFDDYRALCFHHTNPEIKEFEVGFYAGTGASIERLKKEIEKCVVLCANCHYIEHHNIGM